MRSLHSAFLTPCSPRHHVLISLLILASGLPAKAQSCSNSICGPYSAPMYGCLSGNGTGTGCLTNNHIGFYSTGAGDGSFTDSFEGIDSCKVARNECEKNAPYDIDPNGGVGQFQFLQSLNTVIQAWDKKTGKGIFVSTKSGKTPSPQPTRSPFIPGLKNHCGAPGGDILAMYDHVDNRFLIAFKARWTDGNNFNHYSWCIAVSAQEDLYGAGASRWSAYDFVLDSVLPTDSKISNDYYFPDYPKLGTWDDGNFYVSWDLEGPVNYQIYGSEICSVDRTAMVSGNGANPMTCYVYWPAGQTGGQWNPGTELTLIHTILPADIESSAALPPNGRSPLFLAIVNPSNGKGAPCRENPCTSNQLALWSWNSFSGEEPPRLVAVDTYTPGCYDPDDTPNTICEPQPGVYRIDSVGDRMMHRLIYRNFGSSSGPSGEILAAAHTIDDPKSKRTDIRHYLLQLTGDSTASVLDSGNLTNSKLSLFMPSMAFDKNGDLGFIYSTSANCTEADCYPALYFTRKPYLKTGSGGILIKQGKAENRSKGGNWGDYFGAGIDPVDDVTFWGTGEYFDTNETNSAATWQTRIVKMSTSDAPSQ